MATPAPGIEFDPQASIDLDSPEYYINRELSLLDFQRRVLEEAQDEGNPLLERAKFLSIVSSNLDEFFMVRVAGLQQQVAAGVHDISADGLEPPAQLAAVRKAAARLKQKGSMHQNVACPRSGPGVVAELSRTRSLVDLGADSSLAMCSTQSRKPPLRDRSPSPRCREPTSPTTCAKGRA